MMQVSPSESLLRARASWPICIVSLGRGSEDDLSASTSPAQRLAVMWALAKEAWALMGRPVPDYDRAHAPVRVVRGNAPGQAPRQ